MPMTDLEKAQNRAAARVRTVAHTARRRQLQAAVEAAEKAPEVLEAEAEMKRANDAADLAMQHCNSRILEIENQIASLQLEIAALRSAPEQEELRQARRKKGDAWFRIKHAKVKAAEEQFPDLQGPAKWSVAAWKPPADVLERMEQARAAATVGAVEAADGAETGGGRRRAEGMRG